MEEPQKDPDKNANAAELCAPATPADPYRVVYILMTILGVGILTPFNALVRSVCNCGGERKKQCTALFGSLSRRAILCALDYDAAWNISQLLF